MKKAVIFDIDGVLAKKSPDREYRDYDKVDLDSPIEQGFELLYHYTRNEYAIILVTGRKELCREKTQEFLAIHSTYQSKVSKIPFEYFEVTGFLQMRNNNDNRPAVILKKEIYDTYIKDKYKVVAVFEDDPIICEMYKKEGLFVFQVGTRDNFNL